MRNPVYTDVLENEIKILSTLNHRNSSFSVFWISSRKFFDVFLFSCYVLRFVNRSNKETTGFSNYYGICWRVCWWTKTFGRFQMFCFLVFLVEVFLNIWQNSDSFKNLWSEIIRNNYSKVYNIFMKIIFYIVILNLLIFLWIVEGNEFDEKIFQSNVFFFSVKSKSLILAPRNVSPVYNCARRTVLVRNCFQREKFFISFITLVSGTLQYMSPDVVLVPPMGYGPEVRRKAKNESFSFRFRSGRYLERWLYSDRNGNRKNAVS